MPQEATRETEIKKFMALRSWRTHHGIPSGATRDIKLECRQTESWGPGPCLHQGLWLESFEVPRLSLDWSSHTKKSRILVNTREGAPREVGVDRSAQGLLGSRIRNFH